MFEIIEKKKFIVINCLNKQNFPIKIKKYLKEIKKQS